MNVNNHMINVYIYIYRYITIGIITQVQCGKFM